MSGGDRLAGVIDDIAEAAQSLRDVEGRREADEKTEEHLRGIASAAGELRSLLRNSGPDPAQSSAMRHEIRNRLNHISGPCQLLQRRLGDGAGATLDAIEELVDVAAALVEENAQAAPRDSLAMPEHALTGVSPARILVAEDDATNRAFLHEVLTGDGYEVEIATDGLAALERAQNADLDLLLLDLGLPRISGFDVLEKMQASGWRTPVIVVTGRRGVDDAVRCIEHGADDFLTKPIQIEILRARVKSCVEKMRLREREFAQFFPPKLARSFARRPSLIHELPSRHADISILFCDIRNFTSTSERLGPDKTTRWLRGVMHELSELVIANEGVLVDFAGDEIMAMWGAPDDVPDHATRACNTAVQILERLPAMSAQWAGETGGETDLAIGVNSGRALVGHVGTARKTKYGALGDAVNIGSRVLGATTPLKSRLLVSGATRNAIDPSWSRGDVRRLCRVRVKNIVQAIELYEVVPASADKAALDLRERYEGALRYYEQRSLREAAAMLGLLLVDYPDDGPSLMLMSRVVNAMSDDGDFDPVWTISGK